MLKVLMPMGIHVYFYFHCSLGKDPETRMSMVGCTAMQYMDISFKRKYR